MSIKFEDLYNKETGEVYKELELCIEDELQNEGYESKEWSIYRVDRMNWTGKEEFPISVIIEVEPWSLYIKIVFIVYEDDVVFSTRSVEDCTEDVLKELKGRESK